MTRDDLLITWFGLIDDGLKALWHGKHLRQRGPEPTLADSEVITMEVMGEYLGLNTDTAIFAFFRSHYQAFFPKLAHLYRTPFLRQSSGQPLPDEGTTLALYTRSDPPQSPPQHR
jgi:hypothetical protein